MKTLITPRNLIAGAGLLAVSAAYAVMAKPGLIEALQPDGTTVTIRLEGDDNMHRAVTEDGFLLTTDANGFYVRTAIPADELEPLQMQADGKRRGPGLMPSLFPSTGNPHSLVILVEFSDKKFSVDNPNDYYTRMLNEYGFSDYESTGSAREYFVQNSGGLFSPTFDVYGPVQLPNKVSYYGANDWSGNDSKPHEMVIDACNLLDGEIDFKDYDCNGDGKIDNIYVFYAGYGEADGGGASTIWPHSANVTQLTWKKHYFDDVQLDHYACSNELQRVVGSSRQVFPDGIGTFCHEFGHVLGLPDLYATAYTTAFTPGNWDVMASGSYNNKSRTPSNYSSYERYALDWMTPEVVTAGEKTLHPIGESNHAFIIKTKNENEYFLLENRQERGFDAYLPGHGMLIWHIDYDPKVFANNTVNNNSRHQYVDLIEADDRLDGTTLKGDPFPGATNNREFSYNSIPSLRSWTGDSLYVRIYDITETPEGLIQFNVATYFDDDPDYVPEDPGTGDIDDPNDNPNDDPNGEIGDENGENNGEIDEPEDPTEQPEEDGVSVINADETEGIYFDLQGRRVKRPSPGLYIRWRNGRAERVLIGTSLDHR